MSDHVKPYLNRLVILFGQPKTDDVTMFLGEYARVLTRFKPAELEAGIDRLVTQHRIRSFPTIAECSNAIYEAAKSAALLAPKSRSDAEPKGWSPRDLQIADVLCRSDMGRQALRDGWIGALHEFCARTERLPRSHEQSDLIAASSYLNRCASGQVDMGASHAALLKLAGNMIERRNTIAERVFPRSRSMAGERE
jgi:hypothetical protein